MKKPWRYHGECCASGGSAAQTLGDCGPSGFGLGTSLGKTFTMIPPRLFQIMSQCSASCGVPEEVPESIVGVPEEAVDGVHDGPEEVSQEAELGLGGGQQGEGHQGQQQERGPGGQTSLNSLLKEWGSEVKC